MAFRLPWILALAFLHVTTASRIHLAKGSTGQNRLSPREASGEVADADTIKLEEDGTDRSSVVKNSGIVDMAPLSKDGASHNVTVGARPLSLLQTAMGSTMAMAFERLSAMFGATPAHSEPEPRIEAVLDKAEAHSGSKPWPVGTKRFATLVIVVLLIACWILRQLVLKKATSEGHQKRIHGRQQYILKDRILYEWDQTARTITIYTKMPATISKNNPEVKVLIAPRHVQVGQQGLPPFMNDELFASVDAEASSWCVSKKGELEICLQKVEEGEWPCVISGRAGSNEASQSSL